MTSRTTLREAYEYPFTRIAPGEGVHIDPPSVAIYETVVAKGSDRRTLPMLASGSWISEDRLTWRFPLRPGLRFHSGARCTAQSVVEAFEHLRWNAFHATEVWYWHPVETLSAPSEDVLQVTLRHPYDGLPSLLWGTHTAVFNERGRAANPDRDGFTRADGTGPFKLETWSRARVVAKRWDVYPGWPGSPMGSGTLDRIEWSWVPGAADRVEALLRDDVDLIHAPDPRQVAALAADPRFVVYELDQPSSIYLGLNWDRPEVDFNDSRMRRAISALIDRPRMVRDVLGGHGYATVNAVPPGEFHDPDVAPDVEPDRDAAAAVLDELGWTRGPDGTRQRGRQRLAFECLMQDDEVMRGLGARLVADLAAGGVEFRPTYLPVFEAFYAACQQQPMSFVNKWLWQDPIDALIGFTASYCRPSPNWEQAADPVLDRLYADWLRTENDADRTAVASAVQRQLLASAAIVPLVTPTDIWVHSTRVQGFEPWSGCLYPYYHAVRLDRSMFHGMLDPRIDDEADEFCYFWHPTEVIGSLFAPLAAEVTPEGYVYTGFGELMLFVGNPPRPIDQRVRTLASGRLPIVEYDVVDNGLRYSLSLFAAHVEGTYEDAPTCFITVRVRNESAAPRAGFFSTAYRFAPPRTPLVAETPAPYRFRQRWELLPAERTDGFREFDPAWRYAFEPDALVRDGRLLYTFPTEPAPFRRSLSLADPGTRAVRFFTGETLGDLHHPHRHHPETPLGVVMYRLQLAPGEEQVLHFRLPILPPPAAGPEARAIRGVDVARERERTAETWERLAETFERFVVPERKVQDAVVANVINNLLAIDRVGEHLIQNTSPFQYHYYFPGNSSDVSVSLDLVGLDEIAGECVRYALQTQTSDGALGSIGVPTDGDEDNRSVIAWGYVLWAWDWHHRLSGDRSVLEDVYPAVVRGVDWQIATSAKDPAGLMPTGKVPDDAYIMDAHQSGETMWVMTGLRSAERMARAMGDQPTATRIRESYTRFRANFDRLLAAQTARSGGVITPSLERTLGGNHWDNLQLLYPEPHFEPFDPRVTATIADSRSDYREGLMGYRKQLVLDQTEHGLVFDESVRLHQWQTPNNSQNALARGGPEDQELAIRDLYAMLVHTSATHATQEYGSVAWGDRDYEEENLLPDGATSARIIALVRNMLVREWHDELHLLSAVSPEWFRPGDRIALRSAPTFFGPISADMQIGEDGWSVSLDSNWREAPREVVVHVPWYASVDAATADGQPVAVGPDGALRLSPDTKRLDVRGRVTDRPALSYQQAVADYRREYARRYETFLETGELTQSESRAR